MSGAAYPVDLFLLSVQLAQGARRNAYEIGERDGLDDNYRRDELFGGDDDLGKRYDAGYADSERQDLDDFMGHGDEPGTAAGFFVGRFCRAALHDGTPDGIKAALEFVQSPAA